MALSDVRWYHALVAFVVVLVVAGLTPKTATLESQFGPSTGRLAIIQLNGPISYSSNIRQQGVTPGAVSELTQKAVEDGANAVLYEINSGGGGVVASQEAARIIGQADVPTVCRFQEVAASGAYWMATECDVIIANPLSVTGSIGVSSAYLEFSELLNRFGIDYVNLTAGKYKDMGSQYKNLTDAERERFEEILGQVHDTFIDAVAENRNMSRARVAELATGEIYLGREAVQNGMVDRLGGRETAVEAAKELTNMSTLRTRTYEPDRQFDVLSLLFSKIGEGIAHGIDGQSRRGITARWER